MTPQPLSPVTTAPSDDTEALMRLDAAIACLRSLDNRARPQAGSADRRDARPAAETSRPTTPLPRRRPASDPTSR